MKGGQQTRSSYPIVMPKENTSAFSLYGLCSITSGAIHLRQQKDTCQNEGWTAD